jgi:glutamate N-acetyltransferase/amino-acid N-acetyltransferase
VTDLSVPRELLRQALFEVVQETFNALSVDTDQSTSDTVTIVSSGKIPFDEAQLGEFKAALKDVCQGLSEDIVRNGEGAHHVMRVVVRGAASVEMAKGVGKSVVNSPLLKCAVAGNDPNVGRLVMAVGKYMGKHHKELDITRRMKMKVGGVIIFENGEMVLNDEIEQLLVDHMRQAQLTEPTRGGLDVTSHDFPPHGKFVEVRTSHLMHRQVCTHGLTDLLCCRWRSTWASAASTHRYSASTLRTSTSPSTPTTARRAMQRRIQQQLQLPQELPAWKWAWI